MSRAVQNASAFVEVPSKGSGGVPRVLFEDGAGVDDVAIGGGDGDGDGEDGLGEGVLDGGGELGGLVAGDGSFFSVGGSGGGGEGVGSCFCGVAGSSPGNGCFDNSGVREAWMRAMVCAVVSRRAVTSAESCSSGSGVVKLTCLLLPYSQCFLVRLQRTFFPRYSP